MKLMLIVSRSVTNGFIPQFRRPQRLRMLSTFFPGNGTNGNQSTKSSESVDEFERRIFGDDSGESSNSAAFFKKLDKIEKDRDRSSFGSKSGGGNNSELVGGFEANFSSLSDGMDKKLKNAATYFEFTPDEIAREDYTFRPDMSFYPDSTYETKDLDLEKPGVRKFPKRREFEVSTKDALRKADFRNVRFLANFMSEAGLIIHRNQTRVSAKAQRRIAKEIKTARSFGLMPFTTMGTKHFVFGKSMENLDQDYEYTSFDSRSAAADAERN